MNIQISDLDSSVFSVSERIKLENSCMKEEYDEHISFHLPEDARRYYKQLARILGNTVLECSKKGNKIGSYGIQVLDLGCGRGELLHYLGNKNINCLGIDINAKSVKLSSKYSPCLRADIKTIDKLLKSDTVQIVVLSHVLEHISNPTKLMESIICLKPQWVLIAVPNLAEPANIPFQKEPAYIRSGHYHGWDPNHLKTFLEKSCRMKPVKWISDQVFLPRYIRSLAKIFRVRDFLEGKIFPKIFPLMGHSIIVLCRPLQ